VRTALVALVVTTLIMTGFAGASYGRALAAPGEASWSVRTVDWLRDVGFGGVIDTIENWYFTRHPPANTPPPESALPDQAHRAGSHPVHFVVGPYPLHVVTGRPALRGEGRWIAGRRDAQGVPLIYTSYLRPDPAHASVLAGIAWIRRSGTAAHLVAGTVQPGGGRWPGDAAVPRHDVSRLVATFNSGWRMKDLTGGFAIGQQVTGTLSSGQATAAIDRQGHVTVGEWGRDVTGLDRVVAVRQNLDLIVDRSRVVAGLDTNARGRWGSAHNQLQYTARSGLGIDRGGNLIYVAGTGMNLSMLADTLQAAGAVRAMQLDIHRQMIHFASWQPAIDGRTIPTKLLPAMTHNADRYLVPDQRDFFYITTSPSAH
jgi:hypothetical protein